MDICTDIYIYGYIYRIYTDKDTREYHIKMRSEIENSLYFCMFNRIHFKDIQRNFQCKVYAQKWLPFAALF